jgi:hypothetical protein
VYEGDENMENVVIVSGARTPIGSYGGTLRNLHPAKFTGIVLDEVVKRARCTLTVFVRLGILPAKTMARQPWY